MSDGNHSAPSTNRGAKSSHPPSEFRIDWLTFTVGDVDTIRSFQAVFPEMEITSQPGEVKGRYAYNTGITFTAGRVEWNSQKPELKVLWTFTGQDLDRWRKSGYTDMQLITFVSKLPRLNVTRIDYAIDTYNPAANPDTIHDAWESGRIKTRAKTSSRVETKTRHSSEGVTVYIGSRQSTKILRVYDKARQMKQDQPRTRVELEVKKPYAIEVLRAMVLNGIMRAGNATIAAFVETGVEWFDELVSGSEYATPAKPREVESDWQKWILSTALPQVVKALHEGMPEVESSIRAALDVFDQHKLHGS